MINCAVERGCHIQSSLLEAVREVMLKRIRDKVQRETHTHTPHGETTPQTADSSGEGACSKGPGVAAGGCLTTRGTGWVASE